MARHVVQAGFPVVGFDVQPEPIADLVRDGGSAAATVREAAERADVVVTSLPTAAAAVDVCTELAAAAREGMVVAETSTLPVEVKEQCRDVLAGAGMVLLDCPLSGTGAQALERDVVVYGSGDEAAFESARDVMAAFSRSVRYLGPFGRGSTMKYVANLLVAVHNASTAEAFALGIRAGLDPQQIYDTIRDGAGSSVIFEKRGKLMIDKSYLPATAKVSMFVKDVELIGQLADRLDLPTPMLDATRALYQRAVAGGFADSDAAALLDVMDTASGRNDVAQT